jgi:hypothetical protein
MTAKPAMRVRVVQNTGQVVMAIRRADSSGVAWWNVDTGEAVYRELDGAILEAVLDAPDPWWEAIELGVEIPAPPYQRGSAKIDRPKPPPTKPRELPSLWERAGQFATALASKAVQGAVPQHVLEHRRAVCLGVDGDGRRVSDPCEHAHEHEGHWYCRSCGCPKWKLARLDGGKLAYPALACPRGKFTAVTVSG